MVHPSVIEARLNHLGFKVSRWFQAEIRELQHILMDHEKIIALATGRYYGSFALLVATDQRLLMIDKRVFFMTIEDTRYDMISEIDFNSQLYCSNLTVYTVNKTHKFTSYKHKNELRELTKYIQQRVMEFRQQVAAAPAPIAAATQPAAIPATIPAQPAPPAPVASYDTNDTNAGASTTVRSTAPKPGVVQTVGAAAMQASHRPYTPYIVQGSLMSRGPFTALR